jgi:hypothetical protein
MCLGTARAWWVQLSPVQKPPPSVGRGLYRPGPQITDIYRASEAAAYICKRDTFLELHFTLCWSLARNTNLSGSLPGLFFSPPEMTL